MKTGFLERGGLWVICQGILMLGVLILSLQFHSEKRDIIFFIIGAILMGIGAYFGVAGAIALNKNLTPFPKPVSDAVLVSHGIYSRVRHPLYTSVFLASLGWAITWQSWPAIICSLLLAPFFATKANKEEQWLREQFPQYTDYAKTTWRFIPWVI